MLQQSFSLRAPVSFQAGTQQRRQRSARRLAPVRAQEEPSTSDTAATAEPTSAAAPRNVCTTCGVPLADKPGGCDGAGRIMGGLGAVPGFGWWPIKAYRPCPKLGEAGIRYQRKGQITDEVLFGRGKQ